VRGAARSQVLPAGNRACSATIGARAARLFGPECPRGIRDHQPVCQQPVYETLAEGISHAQGGFPGILCYSTPN